MKVMTITGRQCGACGRITPESEYQAMKFTLSCPNPKCKDPKQAYAEKVYGEMAEESGNG